MVAKKSKLALLFHRIVSDPSAITFREDITFEKFEEIVRLVAEICPDITVTFDDGFESDWLFAAPCLQKKQIHGIFFVVENWLGTPGYLTPTQLEDLKHRGFSIGCHSKNHPDLMALQDPELLEEVEFKSDGIYGTSFSIPFGRARIDTITTAVAQGWSEIYVSSDANRLDSAYIIPRLNITNTTPIWFLRFMLGRQSLAIIFLKLLGSITFCMKSFLGLGCYERFRRYF